MPLRAALVVLLLVAAPVAAQTGIALSGLQMDTGQPVEVTSDSLRVERDGGTAVFTGNVVVIQGDMRLSAAEVTVQYTPQVDGQPRRIDRIIATGGVIFVTPQEVAESASAVYTLADARLTMDGNVLLTQGPNTLASERMVVNLADGTGTLDGRVRTVIDTGEGQGTGQGEGDGN
ncbi:MAG: LptA/OstA family protein [Rhodobacteraceae bacterium]|jgi:lipopolysaccharide export system protein LptA|nr:LptA/OstA family protein [Paracoccaceae bacterium]